MRTGDDEDGHEALDRRGHGCAGEQPRHQRDRSSTERDPRQPERGAVGERLRARARGLRLLHQPHDAGKRGPVSRAGDRDPQRARAVDRAGDHLVAVVLLDWRRLAGDERLVHRAAPGSYDAVRGNVRAGANEHQVAFTQFRDRNLVDVFSGAVGADARRRVRQQLRQLAHGAPRLGDGAHLQPVAEKHDRDERRKLFPERHSGKSERDGETERERDGDCQRDECHHAGEAVLDLAGGALNERPSPVREHRDAEYRGDPTRTGEAGRRITERPGEHVAPDQHWDRERE